MFSTKISSYLNQSVHFLFQLKWGLHFQYPFLPLHHSDSSDDTIIQNVMALNEFITVNVGSTVYTVNGLTIIIICKVTIGRPPITISWLRNGELLDQSRGNVSTISYNN